MSSISGLGTITSSYSAQTSDSGSSTDPTSGSWSEASVLKLASAVSNATRSSNINYMFYNVEQSIRSGDSAGVQSAIDTYTQSLPDSAVYNSIYTAPSAQFLDDLAAIKNDAKKGNLEAATADIQTAQYATPDATTGGISLAFDQHNSSAIAAIEQEGTVNTAHYLASQGLTTTDANTEALSFTINSVVDHSNNTGIAAQRQTDQITDLAASLAKSLDFTQTESITSSSSSLTDIIEKLFSTTVPTSGRKQAYALNNQVLASLDATYGSETLEVH